MVSEMKDSLEATVAELDSAVDWEELRPEHVDGYLSISKRLTTALSDEPPEFPDDSNAGTIARLLWNGQHPDDADLAYVLEHISSPVASVRGFAVEVLSKILDSDPGARRYFLRSREARHRVLQQERNETSHLVSHQLRSLMETVRSARARPKRSRPPLRRNPYVAGLPIRDPTRFYGRKSTLETIQSALGESSGTTTVVVQGARRTGKTSLLYQIRQGALGESFFPVYFDMQAVAGVPLEGFLRNLMTNIEEAVWEEKNLSHGDLQAPEGEADFTALRQFLARVKNLLGPTHLLLLIDEFELLQGYFSDKNMAHQFQSLLEGDASPLLVLAGTRKVEDLGRNLLFLLEISRSLTISFLTPEDTRQLIVEPALGVLEFELDALDRIHHMTAGHPYYTQLLCLNIFDLVQGEGTVRVEHVEEAAKRFVQNPSPHLVSTWKDLSLEEKVVSACLAELESNGACWAAPEELIHHLKTKKRSGIRRDLPKARDAISTLQRIDWLEKEEGRDRYAFRMELVRRWVAERRSIWDVIREYRREAHANLPSARAQILAWLADVTAVSLLWALSYLAIAFFWPGGWIRSYTSAIQWALAGVYFALSVFQSASTPGMLAFGMRLVSPSGLPLTIPRATGASLLFFARSLLWLTLLRHLFAHGISAASVVSFLVLLTFEVVSALVTIYSEHRRSLINRLSGTLKVDIRRRRRT